MSLSNSFWSKFRINEGGIQIYTFDIPTEKINAFIADIIASVFIIFIMYIVIKIGKHLIDKTVERQNGMKISLDEKKAKTLGALLVSVLRYAVYFFGISAILTRFFGTISLTFASIGGVAIGFGAQSLVKDVINGFFILFENQYAVGEHINIENKGGIVESLELRVTKIRDFNGDLHIIPNGLITQVTNHSRGDMRVMVDVDIAYEEDVESAIAVMKDVCEEFKVKNEHMVEGPQVVGVTAVKEYAVTIKVVGKAKSMTQWGCENQLRKDIKLALDKANISIPYPKRRIITEKEDKS
jgi:moderate conductance mechanosensitive channel